MLNWKNKPVQSLSKDELREALSESVSLLLADTHSSNNTDTVLVFSIGLFAGFTISLVGFLLASQL